ncbi:hypothetical protein FLK61_35125 [Paenalkalicoccus suaedae]|uniref:Uncharacterized protein n=1 Tax=Paenalkalicoccus suaedae TaxID=2592382 RepID=A0A859FGW3_9BACI|nr:hypothetical protein [Paenalkalicoccus suaedae]QKS71902.1 hypothetical protein FLK61_35125 [Paenalkalicoccus suaedae]
MYTQYGKLFHLSQQNIDDVDMDFFFDQLAVMEKESLAEETEKARSIEAMGF